MGFAFNAVLVCEASMGFDDLVFWYPREPLKCVDVLREASMKETFGSEEAYEGVSRRWPEMSWVEFMCESVDYQ